MCLSTRAYPHLLGRQFVAFGKWILDSAMKLSAFFQPTASVALTPQVSALLWWFLHIIPFLWSRPSRFNGTVFHVTGQIYTPVRRKRLFERSVLSKSCFISFVFTLCFHCWTQCPRSVPIFTGGANQQPFLGRCKPIREGHDLWASYKGIIQNLERGRCLTTTPPDTLDSAHSTMSQEGRNECSTSNPATSGTSSDEAVPNSVITRWLTLTLEGFSRALQYPTH